MKTLMNLAIAAALLSALPVSRLAWKLPVMLTPWAPDVTVAVSM